MQGFKLNSNGDVVIENNSIVMVEGNELLRQQIESVLSTNKGEWVLNREEGITFSNVIGKGITEDMIRAEIQQGLLQVDSSFVLTFFELVPLDNRRYKVLFTAQTSNGEEISGTTYYE